MTRRERCEGVVYLGLQEMFGAPSVPLFVDPETGTTFAIHRDETMAEALERVDERFAAHAPAAALPERR